MVVNGENCDCLIFDNESPMFCSTDSLMRLMPIQITLDLNKEEVYTKCNVDSLTPHFSGSRKVPSNIIELGVSSLHIAVTCLNFRIHNMANIRTDR